MEKRTGQSRVASTLMCFALAILLAFCCMFAPGGAAFAAKDSSKSSKTEKTEQTTTSDNESAKKSDSSNSASKDSSDSSSKDSSDSSSKDSSSKDSSSSSKSSSSKSNMTAGSSDSTKDDDEKDKKKEEEEKEKEEKERKADEKRAQASAAYAQAAELDVKANAYQAEFDEAQQDRDAAAGLRDETNAQIERENAALESLRGELSDFVIDMYKQGGVTPYLDVMLKSTSYHEFLTSWYMANEVGNYGKAEIKEKNQVIDELQETADGYDKQVEEAERAMKQAESRKRQVTVSILALRAQAASLNVEAAEILDDEDALDDARGELADAQEALDALLEQGVAGDSLLSGTGYFTHPCPDATYSSGFGYRSFDNAFHKGLDMAIAEGTPYYAADSGTVIAATNGGGYNGGAGNWIVIDHGDGLVTKYMHSLVTFVSPGDHVERGQNIGLVGNTGNSFGAHLHFQVEVNGTAVNPMFYL